MEQVPEANILLHIVKNRSERKQTLFFQLLLYVFRTYLFSKILNVDREVRRVLVERNTVLSFCIGPW